MRTKLGFSKRDKGGKERTGASCEQNYRVTCCLSIMYAFKLQFASLGHEINPLSSRHHRHDRPISKGGSTAKALLRERGNHMVY